MTHDIYYVMKAMGHSKITTTEIYSKFNMRRLETDFPSLAESYHKTVKFGKVDTLLVDTERIYSCWKLCTVKPEVASSSLVGPAKR